MIIQLLTESLGKEKSLSSLAHFALLKISKAVLSKEDFSPLRLEAGISDREMPNTQLAREFSKKHLYQPGFDA